MKDLLLGSVTHVHQQLYVTPCCTIKPATLKCEASIHVDIICIYPMSLDEFVHVDFQVIDPLSAGTVFIRQNLTSVHIRF